VFVNIAGENTFIELRKRNATIKAKKKGVPIVLYNHAE